MLGGTLQWAAGNSQDISSQFTPIVAGKTASLDTNGNNVTLASPITGSGGLTRLGGSGMLTITASNTYQGATTIDSVGGITITGTGTLGNFANATEIGPNSGDNPTITVNSPTASLEGSYIRLANNGGSQATVFQSAGLVSACTTNTGNTPGWVVIAATGTAAYNLSGGTLVAAAPGNVQVGVNNGSSGALNISNSGVVQVNGGGNVWIGSDTAGAHGTVVQGGSSSFTVAAGGAVLVGYRGIGSYTLNAGTLATPTLTLGSFAGSNGTLNLNGGLLLAAALNSGSGAATVNWSGGALQNYPGGGLTVTLPVGLSGTNSTVSVDNGQTATFQVTAPISGSGSLTKNGLGTLTLSGSDSYTGGTTVNAGLLVFSTSNALPVLPATGGIMLNIGGAVAAPYTNAPALLGSGVIASSSSGALVLSTTTDGNTYNMSTSGSNACNYPTLSLGAQAGTNVSFGGTIVPFGNTYYLGGGGGSLSVANPLTNVNGSSGAVFGNGGGGTVNLSASQGYTGPTTVNAGTVNVALALSSTAYTINAGATLSASGSLPAASTVAVSGGTLNLQASSATLAALHVTANGAIQGTGTITSTSDYDLQSGSVGPGLAGNVNLVKTTTGTVTLTNAATYTGATNINGGILRLTPVPSGAVVHYNFDAADISGNTLLNLGAGGAADNGLVGANVTFSSTGGMTGGAAVFNGAVNSLIQTAGSVSLGTSFTYSTWLSATTAQVAYARIISNGYQSGGYLGTDNTGGKFLGIVNNSNFPTIGESGVTVSTSGGWNMLSEVVTPATLTLYYNGALVYTTTSVTAAARNAVIGFGNGVSDNYNGWNGRLDEAYVYNQALSAGQIQQLYANANTNNVLPTTTAVELSQGGTLDLNGFNQTIASLTSSDSTTQITLGAGQLTLGDSNSTTFAGTISGLGSLVKQGSGTLTLGGANTYAGATTVTAGALQLANSGAVGMGTVNLAVNNGLAFAVGSAALGGLSGSGNLALADGSSPLALTVGGNNANTTYSGVLSGTGGSLVKIGSGTLTLATPNNNNSFAGSTTILGGTLQLALVNNGAVVHYNFDAGDITGGTLLNLGTGGSADNGLIGSGVTFAGGKSGNAAVFTGASNSILQTAGNVPLGTSFTYSTWLSATNANTAYARIISNGYTNGGYLGTDNNGKYLGIANNSNFNGGVGDSAQAVDTTEAWHMLSEVVTPSTLTLYYDGSLIYTTTAVTAAARNAAIGFGYGLTDGGPGWNGKMDEAYVFNQALSASQIQQLYANPSGANSLPTTTSVQIAAGATLDLAGVSQQIYSLSDTGGSGGSVTSSIPGLVTLTISGTATTGFSGTIQNGSGMLALVMSGSGLQTLSGSNTYNGGTTVSGGTLQLGNLSALGTGGLTTSGGVLDLHGFSLTVGNSNALPSLTGSAGIITDNSAGPGTTSLTVKQSGSTTYSGALLDGANKSLALVAAGTGTLDLSGSNGYSGGTTVSGGILQVGNSAALGAQTGSLTLSSGTLNLNNYSPTVGALTGNANSVVTTLGGTSAFTLTTSTSSTTTFAGTLLANGGTMSLVKTGTGTLLLTGASNYTGSTSINQGTLAITSIGKVNAGVNTSLGNPNASSGTIIMGSAGPATLQFLGTYASTDRPINLQGPATIDASGGTNSNGNTFQLTASPNSIAATGQSLTLTGTTPGIYGCGGEIVTSMSLGSGSLTKNGPGAWTLDSPAGNSFGGGTTLNAGLLVVSNTSGSALGNGNLTINGGTLMASGPASISGSVLPGSGAYTIEPDFYGSFGTLAVGGLTTASNQTTLSLTLGSPLANGTYGGDVISVANGGVLSIAPSTAIALNSLPTAAGDYRLLADSNTGTLSSVNTANFVLPSPASNSVKYSLSTTADSGYLDLVVAPTVTTPSYTLSSSAAFHTLIVGGSSPVTTTLVNIGGGAARHDPLQRPDGHDRQRRQHQRQRGQRQRGPERLGASTASFTSNTPGSYTITPVATVSGSAGTTPILTQTTTDAVNVLGHAAPLDSPITLDLGTVHAGYASAITSAAGITVTNGSSGDPLANLKGSGAGANGVSLTTLSGVTPGNSGTLQASLATGLATGTLLKQSVNYTFADDSSRPAPPTSARRRSTSPARSIRA